MKAMQLDKPAPIETHPLTLRDVPTPKPGNGQLLVKISACGVCRSNLHTIEGDWLASGVPAISPIVPGHEIVGRVAEVGANVDDFRVGDRVGIQPLWSSCLHCEFCLTGRENLCRTKEITGETLDGGYAEYMLSTAAHTYHLPDNLDDAEAAPLFCPGITAYHAVEKAKLAPGKRMVLFGMGGVGHMVVQFARLTGADVITVARGKQHRELAEQLGSIRTIDPVHEDPSEVLARMGGADAALVFAPSSDMLRQALASVKPGGIVVNGAATEPGTVAFNDEKTLVGSVIGGREEMRKVLEIAAAGKVKVVVEKFRLDQAEEALLRLKQGDIEARAVLVM